MDTQQTQQEPDKKNITTGDTHIGDVSGNMDIKQAGRDIVGGNKVEGNKFDVTFGDILGSPQIAVGSKIHQTQIIIHRDGQKLRIPLQLPPRAEHFTDREQELAQLLQNLQPERVVTLCGPGGIGKSALAAEAIWHLAPGDAPPERFPDGIIWHDFYKESEADKALEHIALSFGEEPRPTPLDAARRALAGRTVLLLLDGTEEADDLPKVLSIKGNCGVIVTSRKRTDAVTEPQDIPSLQIKEAVKLLHAWGKEYGADETAVRHICELVGSLPLAVRLAGRYILANKEPAKDYLEWLKITPLEALNQGDRKLESVPLLLQRSLEQVSEDACKILAVCGVLAFAPFSKETLSAVLPAMPLRRPLNELVNYGLLLRSYSHYAISHALIHTYARKRLQSEDVVITRLIAYYKQLTHTQQDLGSEGHATLNRERAHIMSVLGNCVEKRDDWKSVKRLVRELRSSKSYLRLQGYWIDLATAIEFGLMVARQLDDSQDEQESLHDLGNVYRDLGQMEKALECYVQALAIAHEIGDCKGEARHIDALGLVYRSLGQREKAIGYYKQALAIAHEIGDCVCEIMCVRNLGDTYRELSQCEQALECYKHGIVIARKIGLLRAEGFLLGDIGVTYSQLKLGKQAITCLKQALAIIRKTGNRKIESRWVEVLYLNYLGNIYSKLGQAEEAIASHKLALAIARDMGHRQGEMMHLASLGFVYAQAGQMEKALEYCEQALAIAREIGDRHSETTVLGRLGVNYLAFGQVEQAIECSEQALAIARKLGFRTAEMTNLSVLGFVYAQAGQTEKAIECSEQALAIAREIGDRHSETTFLIELGTSYLALGQVEQAIECSEQGLAIAREFGFRLAEGTHLSLLGRSYRILGQVKQAKQFLQQALAIFEEIKSSYAGQMRKLLEELDKE